MANEVWYEINTNATRYGNVESAHLAAVKTARESDDAVEVYQVTRALVRTIQRSVSITDTPVP